jgi:hypothetical protein
MSSPGTSSLTALPVAITVTPNPQADRVIYTFGDQCFGLTVEDVMLLVNHSLAAVDVLRPQASLGVVQ